MSTEAVVDQDLEPQEQIRGDLQERIESDSLDLPLLPQVANQVMTLSQDPDADAAKLSSLIHQDQALAGQILRIANSPAYMPRSTIVSLQQAVSWLGMKMLADLALMVSFQNGVFRVAGYDPEIKVMWKHALATALYGKEIARMKRHNVENAFLCGLLHTMGKPVVLQTVVDIQKQYGVTLSWDIMNTFLTDLHVQVGVKLATSWELPAQVIESIMYYANYSQAPSTNKTAMATCLADYFASALLGPTEQDEEVLRSLPVIQDLNLYPEEVTALLEPGPTIRQTVDSMAV